MYKVVDETVCKFDGNFKLLQVHKERSCEFTLFQKYEASTFSSKMGGSWDTFVPQNCQNSNASENVEKFFSRLNLPIF